ncbi:MAG TPA: cysteine--tRNA ligase [Rhabdochlamydiaceae bacterium]|jgi:cysteinyl-tRNA synthetase
MQKTKLKIYNTETREKEEVVPSDGRTVRMYTCGPTVYNFAHIGNFRTYVFEDLLRRALKFLGYMVKQAMNLTDVDDKTIKGAIENNISLDTFTTPYKEAFFDDLKTLNIEPVEYYPQATDYIREMIVLIQKLLDKGIAYKGEDGSIYYAIAKFPAYGRLSHLHLNELKAGASGVAADEYDKENVSDFVLWKIWDFQRDGEIFWESPFGKGRPGWHIECSAMAMKLLGESIDIHVGGVDNIFPHHENEIAQSEGATQCRFARYWVHSEHLLVDHKKMSKSLGNFYTLRDLLARGYSGTAVRYMLLQVHYRTQLNFTFTGLDAAVATLERMGDFIARLQTIREQKMQKALDFILDKALPNQPLKKQVQERILLDIKALKEKNILDPHVLEPILERSLPQTLEKKELVNKILATVADEKMRTLLGFVLDKNLAENSEKRELMLKVWHQVHDEKDRDILDPDFMKPILQKTLGDIPVKEHAVENILHDLKVKKSHGFIFPILDKTMKEFKLHLADDLNISAALASIFDMVRQVNTLCDEGRIGISEAEDVLDFLGKCDEVLGVLSLIPQAETIGQELLDALARREKARLEKNWKMADECRLFIQSQGYLIKDTPQGPQLKKVKQ